MSLDPAPSPAELLRMKAEREARRAGGARYQRTVSGDPLPAKSPEFVWPVRLTIPWSLLVSDNDKHIPNTPMLLTKEYREAKAKIAQIATQIAPGAAPTTEPLELTARVWLPRQNAGDIVNRAKIVHDALEKIIYRNDAQLHAVHWHRAGVDVDAPRAEINIVLA